MAICNILNLRCVFVNELIGDVLLSVIFGMILYFVVASKLRLGFDTTMAFMVPLILIFGLMFAGFSTIYYVLAIVVGILLAWIFNEMIRNR